jgi:hypothetical protein
MNNCFLNNLILDTKIRLNFLIEEILHSCNIINFFSVGEYVDNRPNSTNLRDFFHYIRPIATNLLEEINALKKYIEQIDKLQNCLQLDSKANETSSYLHFFKLLISFKEKEKSILEKLDFLQTKIISSLESFPNYNPTPKKSSIREAAKTHKYLEILTSEFLKLFSKKFLGDERNISYFFWKFSSEINFLDDKDLLIVNTDSYLPFQPKAWIIFAHEALHFLFHGAFKKQTENSKDMSYILNESSFLWELTLNGALLKAGIKSSKIDKESFFTDLLIDSILSRIFSLNYIIPALTYLFLFDEEDFFSPNFNRIWYLRCKNLIDELDKIDNPNSDLKQFVEDSKKLLEYYSNLQFHAGDNLVKFLHREEEIIYRTTKEFIEKILSKKLKQIIKKLRKELEQNKIIENYLQALKFHLQFYSKPETCNNSDSYKEGRLFARVFFETHLNTEDRIDEEKLNNYLNAPVYKFQFYKVRYDIEIVSKFLNEINNYADAICFGDYTFLKIFSKENRSKVYEECANELDSLKLFFKNENLDKNPEENDKMSCPEIQLMTQLGLKYFRKDYTLILYESLGGNSEILDNPKELKNYLLIFIEANLLNNTDIRKIKEHLKTLKSYLEEIVGKSSTINIHLFISYQWFDLGILIALKPIGKISLEEILKEIKIKLLAANKVFSRTETHIFIGTNIMDKVKIRKPKIILRLSSPKLGETIKILEKLIRKVNIIENTALLYGIRDIETELITENETTFQELWKKIQTIVRESNYSFSDIQFIVSVPFSVPDPVSN